MGKRIRSWLGMVPGKAKEINVAPTIAVKPRPMPGRQSLFFGLPDCCIDGNFRSFVIPIDE